MTTLDQIKAYAQHLGERFAPQRIILFGSYAHGHPTPGSDVDLLVVAECERDPIEKSFEMQLKLRPPFPLELHVRTPQKIKERLEMGGHFIREIISRRGIFYESAHP